MKRAAGELRIVGGAWRGRRIGFPASPELRPTPDRLRETLFNWLGEWVVGRRVLDLYAGSGALGIEALSRGATSAVFVERAPAVARALAANLERLGARGARVERMGAGAWLAAGNGSFDLVFLDPPYRSEDGPAALAGLVTGHFLVADHRVYLERPARDPVDAQTGWETLRSSRAGGAAGYLLRRRSPAWEPDGTG